MGLEVGASQETFRWWCDLCGIWVDPRSITRGSWLNTGQCLVEVRRELRLEWALLTTVLLLLFQAVGWELAASCNKTSEDVGSGCFVSVLDSARSSVSKSKRSVNVGDWYWDKCGWCLGLLRRGEVGEERCPWWWRWRWTLLKMFGDLIASVYGGGDSSAARSSDFEEWFC